VKWPKIICISGDHEYIAGPYEQRNNWQLVTNLTSGQTYEIRVVAKSGFLDDLELINFYDYT
jgi:hypothetical protein